MRAYLYLFIIFVLVGCQNSENESEVGGSEGGNEVGGSENESADCREVSRACVNGFQCEMNSIGEYECFPVEEVMDSRVEVESGDLDSGVEVGGNEVPIVEVPLDDDFHYKFLVIQDKSTDINNNGTPGVDICEISVDCNGAVDPSDFYLGPTDSPVCDGSNDDNCLCVDAVDGVCRGTNRNDVNFAFDGNVACSPDGFVSLGINGTIIAEYDLENGLAGCFLTVHELNKDGSGDGEVYQVGICQNDTDVNLDDALMAGGNCVNLGSGTGDTQNNGSSWDL